MKIVAFDLDGTLQTEEGLRFYREQKNRDNTKVGILTAGDVSEAKKFAKEKNLDPDFVMRGIIKSIRLVVIAGEIDTSKQHIYVGDRVTDRMAAVLAGWEFKDIREIKE